MAACDYVVVDAMTVNLNGDDGMDATQLAKGVWVWVWTSPGGACHQGAKHYRRRDDAVRAGREWLAERFPAPPGPTVSFR